MGFMLQNFNKKPASPWSSKLETSVASLGEATFGSTVVWTVSQHVSSRKEGTFQAPSPSRGCTIEFEKGGVLICVERLTGWWNSHSMIKHGETRHSILNPCGLKPGIHGSMISMLLFSCFGPKSRLTSGQCWEKLVQLKPTFDKSEYSEELLEHVSHFALPALVTNWGHLFKALFNHAKDALRHAQKSSPSRNQYLGNIADNWTLKSRFGFNLGLYNIILYILKDSFLFLVWRGYRAGLSWSSWMARWTYTRTTTGRRSINHFRQLRKTLRNLWQLCSWFHVLIIYKWLSFLVYPCSERSDKTTETKQTPEMADCFASWHPRGLVSVQRRDRRLQRSSLLSNIAMMPYAINIHKLRVGQVAVLSFKVVFCAQRQDASPQFDGLSKGRKRENIAHFA